MNGMEHTTHTDVTADGVAAGRCGSLDRRAATRGLVASLLALAGGGAAVAEAKKKKRKKRKKRSGNAQGKSRQTCRPGSRVAFLSVPSDGTEIITPALARGQRYTLRASGFWSTNGDYFNDAAAAFHAADPRDVHLFHNGVRLGLSVDGDSPDLWGQYSFSHEYTTSVTGQGRGLALRMQDSVYTDNARLLNLEVVCG